MIILKAFFQEHGTCFHQQDKFPLGYFACCFKTCMFCNFWHTYEVCIFNEKCTLERELSLFSFDGKEVLRLVLLICLCHGAHFTSNCAVYTEHYLYILVMWASVSVYLQDHSAFSYSSLFKRSCSHNQDTAAKRCGLVLMQILMFTKDFLCRASLHLDAAAQEACCQSCVLNSEQNRMIETKLWIQYNIDYIYVFILLLFGKSDILCAETTLLSSATTKTPKSQLWVEDNSILLKTRFFTANFYSALWDAGGVAFPILHTCMNMCVKEVLFWKKIFVIEDVM